MALDPTSAQLATIPWLSMDVLLLAGLSVLTVIRAIQRTEVGYENESGFHYGTPTVGRRMRSRSGQSLALNKGHSCHHSRLHENLKSCAHRRRPKVK